MENQIRHFSIIHKHKFIPIENDTSLKIIHEALINDNVDKTTEFTDSIIYLYYGIYYEANNQYDNALKYYKKASDLENDTASLYLSYIYRNKGNIQEMITYLLISANKGNIEAIYHLATYFIQ